jgi:hypothetical protein
MVRRKGRARVRTPEPRAHFLREPPRMCRVPIRAPEAHAHFARVTRREERTPTERREGRGRGCMERQSRADVSRACAIENGTFGPEGEGPARGDERRPCRAPLRGKARSTTWPPALPGARGATEHAAAKAVAPSRVGATAASAAHPFPRLMKRAFARSQQRGQRPTNAAASRHPSADETSSVSRYSVTSRIAPRSRR